MANQAFTYQGSKFYISTETATDDMDETALEALTWTEVSNVGKVGTYGFDTNIVTYPTLGDVFQKKAKGITNAGDPEVEMAQNPGDPGQEAMAAAGAANQDAYAFKYEKSNGVTDYMVGVVTGPTEPGGGNEDFVLSVYTLALTNFVRVNPTPA